MACNNNHNGGKNGQRSCQSDAVHTFRTPVSGDPIPFDLCSRERRSVQCQCGLSHDPAELRTLGLSMEERATLDNVSRWCRELQQAAQEMGAWQARSPAAHAGRLNAATCRARSRLRETQRRVAEATACAAGSAGFGASAHRGSSQCVLSHCALVRRLLRRAGRHDSRCVRFKRPTSICCTGPQDRNKRIARLAPRSVRARARARESCGLDLAAPL